MQKELKVRIDDHRKIEERLKPTGAAFDKELSVKDTYFNQPEGEVLKVSETSEGNFLMQLSRKGGRFRITGKNAWAKTKQKAR